jgi:cytochrome c553
MNHFFPLSIFFILAALAIATQAEPLTVTDWQQAVIAKPEGNAESGQQRYREQGCAGCHGVDGVPENRDWPVLAGQRPLYLYKMLLDYRAGRVGGAAGIMGSMVAGLDEPAMADIAAWLGQRSRPPAASHSSPPAILRGDRARLIPPCEACHGANGQGWDVQPAIMGQNRSYLDAVLVRFKRGERNNDLNAGMSMIAKQLSEEEIHALAEHYGR